MISHINVFKNHISVPEKKRVLSIVQRLTSIFEIDVIKRVIIKSMTVKL